MQLISGLSKFLRASWTLPAVTAATVLALTPPQAGAQSLFSPAIRVNQDIVTWYELQQRQQFLELLGVPGASEEEVRQALIDDRLRGQAMREAGIQAAPEDVQTGIDEFAARGQLTTEQFLQVLGEAGVDPETVRDFIADQLSWRDYVAARF
ncbi:SurA N-terminal domain-containing protein, partial [Ruegeria sp.]|uniref:SurA N-terminal domain-containing protein n=1 Tax=Ruegeria sp. TaxID=1879320 RepID=UPI0023172D7C